MSRRARCLLAAATMSWIGIVAAPASAHSVYDRSSPNDGDTIDAPIDELWIEFTRVIDPRESQSYIVLTDPCGAESPGTNYRYLGKRMTVDVEVAEPGSYEVFWRVLDPQDGHVTYGTFDFTLAGSSGCAAPEPSNSATPTASPTASPTQGATPTSDPTQDPTTSPTDPSLPTDEPTTPPSDVDAPDETPPARVELPTSLPTSGSDIALGDASGGDSPAGLFAIMGTLLLAGVVPALVARSKSE